MADNPVTPITAGTALATKDIGGVQYPKSLITDQVGADVMGLLTANPDPLSFLGRLKAIATALAGLPASLGPKAGAASMSIVPATDAGLATAAKQDTSGPSNVYVSIAFASTNLTGGACKAIVAEVAGRVNLKQPDGTPRANYPLVAGLNPIGALMIDAPTSGTAATGIWALY
jgi:hypothetical protein